MIFCLGQDKIAATLPHRQCQFSNKPTETMMVNWMQKSSLESVSLQLVRILLSTQFHFMWLLHQPMSTIILQTDPNELMTRKFLYLFIKSKDFCFNTILIIFFDYLIKINYKQSMSITSEDLNREPYEFRQYSYRIVITLLYSTASIINGMCWVVVTPIAVPIENTYQVSAIWVAFIPMSYMIFFVILNFPSNWVIDVKGIKKGVVIGASLTFLGCLIRCLVKVSFAFVVVGQVFCAIAQPFLINAPMKIATRWFIPQNRSLAMAVLTVVNIIGTAIGFLIPPLFVSELDTPQIIKDNFFILLMVQVVISAISAILIMIFFKESPPTLPSLGSMAETVDFKKSIGMMFRDKKFMSLSFAFGTVNGTFNIYGSLMDDILDPYDFSTSQVADFGTAMMITGIISAGLFGLYVQKTLKYRNIFIFCAIIGLLTTIGFPLALKLLTGKGSDYYWIYMGLVICQGLVFIPLQPLTIDYGSDTMFPIGEAQITGFMLSVGQIFGIFFVYAAQLIFSLGEKTTQQVQKTSAFNSVIFCNAFLAVGCIILMLQNGQLKRANLEQGKNKKQGLDSLIVTQNSSIYVSRTGKESSIVTQNRQKSY